MENTTKIDTFSSYETKAYEYCASIGQPVLVQPLNKFDTCFLFKITYFIYLRVVRAQSRTTRCQTANTFRLFHI